MENVNPWYMGGVREGAAQNKAQAQGLANPDSFPYLPLS